MLRVLFLCLVLNAHVSLGADRISGNQSLSGDQTIESAGGVFVLGFFKPSKASKYYIGMWYKEVRVRGQTVVWVANREKPVFDTLSSELRISDGNLVLFDESKSPIWSTNVTSAGSSPVQAVLNDNGNLVLSDGSDSLRTLWQSFDNLAHTWLPGAKISYNKITKTHQRLTSWKNSEDPSPGLYTLELDPNDDSYIILWNRTTEYWNSGAWDDQAGKFSKVPEMRRNYIYDFNYISNVNESYFTYSVYNTSVIKISRFVMDVSGQIKQLNWMETGWNLFWSQPRHVCEVHALCGAYGSCTENSQPFCRCLDSFKPKLQSNWDLTVPDYTDGCSRKTELQCSNRNETNGENDKFREIPNLSLPENEQRVEAGSSSECELKCLNNCSCTAYAYDDDDHCSVWLEELKNLKQLSSGGKTLYLRLAASEILNPKDNKAVIVGAVVGSVAGIAVILGIILFVVIRRRNAVGAGKAVDGSLLAFGYRDLQNATKNFSEKLGGGGFGSVFKGTLLDSSNVAVKRLDSISQGEKQFRTEVSTIGTIQHVNLVRLRGFCSENTKRLLVYEYMSNGSLDSHLFGEKKTGILDWKTRYQIALGTARGLVYLHEKCRDCIIHCDIKPENILLDADLCPKVADFGLAKLFGRDFSRVLTTMRGTRGYLAPEWIAGVAITMKADVYSYGMMLFEIVYGKRNSEHSEDGKVRFFPTRAANIIVEGGDVLSLLDQRLERNADVSQVERICRVACWCIQDDEANRPAMSQVVQILEEVVEVNVPPIPRSLHVFGDNQDDIIFFTESSSNQTSQTRSNVSTASSQSQAQSTVSLP